MTSDVMNLCADMVLADAIEDFAEKKQITKQEARERIIRSKAYSSLYDFETGLWKDGPDYFISFYEEMEKNRRKKAENQQNAG